MAFLNDVALDAALATLSDGDELHILSAETTSYANIASNTLGVKTNPTIGAAADRTGGGRERAIAAITDGSVTGTGTATRWALVDTVNSRVLVERALSSSQAVTSGNTWTLPELKVGVPDAVAV